MGDALIDAGDALVPGVNILNREGIGQAEDGCRWRTLSKRAAGWLPTRWEGESGVTHSGCSTSIWRSSAAGVELVIADHRGVQDMIAVVVKVDIFAQLLQALPSLGSGRVSHNAFQYNR